MSRRQKDQKKKKMLRSPATRALLGFGGTLFALGGATLAVSTVTSAVIRVAVKARQSKRMVPCRECCCRCADSTMATTSTTSSSSTSSPLVRPGKRRCAVCRGRRAVRWQPFSAPIRARWTLCPLCCGTGEQLCWNCGGTGQVVGSSDAEVAAAAWAAKAKAAEAAAATATTAAAIVTR